MKLTLTLQDSEEKVIEEVVKIAIEENDPVRIYCLIKDYISHSFNWGMRIGKGEGGWRND